MQTQDGQQTLVCGAIVSHYDPFADDRSSGPLSLAQATDDIVEQVQRTNPYLQPEGSPQRTTIDRQRALSVRLSGRSPLTGEDEQVTVYARALPDDHVLYALFVAPRRETRQFEPAFSQIVDSLQVDDRAAHR